TRLSEKGKRITPQTGAEPVAQLNEAQPMTVRGNISSVTDIHSHRFRKGLNVRPASEDRTIENEFDSEVGEEFFLRDGTYGVPIRTIETAPPKFSNKFDKAPRPAAKKKIDSAPQLKGLKKRSLKKSREMNMPPTPLGHDWHLTDGGWNLIRKWNEKNGLIGQKTKKERYAGYLSRDAWEVMKEYEYEKIISQIGQSGRHGGR
ncbi:MAG: hypothetical protein ACRD82_05425, partial [Blastocatellia bacterium]